MVPIADERIMLLYLQATATVVDMVLLMVAAMAEEDTEPEVAIV